MTTNEGRRGGTPAYRVCMLVMLLAGVALPACDTSVTNPGPVQREFLDSPEAQPAMVAGMGRAVAEALNWLAYTGGAVAREFHPSGSTGSFGITIQWQRGELGATDDALDTHWEQAQQARWYAEEGIRIMEDAGPQSDELLAQAYLYAGYANRILGEHMCQAVIDGGSPEPHTVYLERAVEDFDRASQLGTATQQTIARAGRASVHALLGNWDAAAQDAATVPTSFRYQIAYHDIGEDAQKNRVQFAANESPYKAHTQWNTWVPEYQAQFDDPRVPYLVTSKTGDAAIDCCGQVPWWPQAKYTAPGDDINLSSGAEMRLIEAEALLIGGDVAGAMQKINELRTAAGVEPWPATTTAAEAWSHLKRERAVELWIEGRRFGDLRRWEDANRPGALDPLEMPSGDVSVGSHLRQQDLCFPIPPSEQDTNPNVPRASAG